MKNRNRLAAALLAMVSAISLSACAKTQATTSEIAAGESAAEATTAAEEAASADETAAAGETAAAEENATAENDAAADAADSSAEALPSRVVALAESNAELWLLAGGDLIGATEDALDLETMTPDAVSVGDLEKPSVESITALEPDLVICFSSSPGQKAAGERMKELGVNVLFTDIDNFADYAEVMKNMTKMTGRDDLYKTNVADVESAIEVVKDKALDQKKEGSYLMLHVSATKSKVEKNDYFATEIMNDLGLTNMADDSSNMDEINFEAVLKEDPDYIFVVPRGSDKKAKEAFTSQFEDNPAWQELKAVQDGHVYILPKDLFGLKPNAQWADSYEYAYDLLYGEASGT